MNSLFLGRGFHVLLNALIVVGKAIGGGVGVKGRCAPFFHTHTHTHFMLVLAWLLLSDQLIFLWEVFGKP